MVADGWTTLALAVLTIGAILFAPALARFRNTLATIARDDLEPHARSARAQGLFLTQGDALVVQMPGSGIDPSWLARPLEELGLGAGGAVRAVRVESPPEWRWGTADAAFLARVLQGLGRPREDILVQGLPQDLQKLLALARTRSPAGEAGPARSRAFSRGWAHSPRSGPAASGSS